MRVVDFFSGIGGFSLGLERAGFQTVAFCETNPYANAVLKKCWPNVTNLGDIRTIEPRTIPDAELWCGGFPCQPFSVAGLQRGTKDERNLWPDWFRLIRAVRPNYIFMENVPAILSIENGQVFGRLLGDLASCGYDAEWDCLSASQYGALHRRSRIWIVAYSDCGKRRERTRRSFEKKERDRKEEPDCDEFGRTLSIHSDSFSVGWKGIVENPKITRKQVWAEFERLLRAERELAVPTGKNRRMADGISMRTQRLRCLGNAIVPQIATWIGERIMNSEHAKERAVMDFIWPKKGKR